MELVLMADTLPALTPEDAVNLIESGERLARRRERLCRAPCRCPACATRQVQLLLPAEGFARWKCRECGHGFIYEPLAVLAGPERKSLR